MNYAVTWSKQRIGKGENGRRALNENTEKSKGEKRAVSPEENS